MFSRSYVTLSAALLAAAALASGCATIDDHVRVTDWPELKVIEHHVSHTEMRDVCSPYTGFLSSPEGCTLFNFDRMEAHIVVSKDFPSAWVLEHERLHALGYDHVGSDGMKHIWENWRARNQQPRDPLRLANARAALQTPAPGGSGE